MATHLEKSFCILGFYSIKCAVTSTRTATAISISKWHKKFVNAGCFCKGNSLCRPTTSAGTVERVSHAYLRISASRDVGLAANWMYHSQVCEIFFGNVLRSGLTDCKCCDTRHKMMEWYLWNCTRTWWNILQKMNESCQRPVLATKQRSKIIWCNIRSWWSENSHIVVEHVKECPKMIRFVLWTVLKCTDLSSLGKTVIGIICSDMLECS